MNTAISTSRLYSRSRTAVASAFLVFFLCQASDCFASSAIDDYVNAQGGCRWIPNQWQGEFHRSDGTPFGKLATDWQAEDYRTVRTWVEKCLDSFSAAPDRRELVMENVDARLKSFQNDIQNRAAEDQQRAEAVQKRQARKEKEAQDQEAAETQQQEALEAQKSEFDGNEVIRQRAAKEFGKMDILGFSPGMAVSDVSYLLITKHWNCGRVNTTPNGLTQAISAGTNVSCRGIPGQINLKFAPALDDTPVVIITYLFTSADATPNVAQSISDQFGRSYTTRLGSTADTPYFHWELKQGLSLDYASGRSVGSEDRLTIYNSALAKDNDETAKEKEKALHPTPRF